MRHGTERMAELVRGPGRRALFLGLCLAVGLVASPLVASAAASTRRFTVAVTLTSADLRQSVKQGVPVASSPHRKGRFPVLEVDARVRYQPFLGVGGAMTDTSAWLLEDELPPPERDRWMRALFSPSGARLGFIRVPIGASDFTRNGTPYSYDDLPPGRTDPKLRHFSIRHDLAYIVPALREALALNPHVWVMAGLWSPPPWMKGNRKFDNLEGKGTISRSRLGTLANYFVKFIKAYAGQRIPVRAITPQNEPSVKSNYPGADMQAPEEADFVSHFLRPSLRRARLSAVGIYGYDASWGNYPWDLVGQNVAQDLSGIAWHCYVNGPDLMARFHNYQPQLDQMVSECATPPKATTAGILISSFRDWATRVNLWNLALDQSGGPVEHPNVACAGCTGIITVNTKTHTAKATLDYFQLAQVSHYVLPGAVRIASSTFVNQDVNPPTTLGVNDVVFRNPNGQRVLIAYNNAKVSKWFTVHDNFQYYNYRLAPGTMATFTWRV